ncbi:hypothetical protein NLI96_g8869 [Meripilus lineatus]|uniref:Uncharacterized protein n=1 Tax=Meripilus lineatus TaxID=2056292 RepID=A0AAD5UWM9_9APHY|nr:hypothetical protein NLI96_g8869 [Physisporinus lineatus]
MQSSKLPIEVCERVIDSLAISVHNPTWNDYFDAVRLTLTMYACALVCRDWVPRSQHHLFHQVKLCTTHQADSFLDTITRHPHRAKSVRYLSISPNPPPSSASLRKQVSPPQAPRPSDSPTSASSLVLILSSDSLVPFTPPVMAPSSPHSPQLSSVSNDRQSNVRQNPSQAGHSAHPSISVLSVFANTQSQVHDIPFTFCSEYGFRKYCERRVTTPLGDSGFNVMTLSRHCLMS